MAERQEQSQAETGAATVDDAPETLVHDTSVASAGDTDIDGAPAEVTKVVDDTEVMRIYLEHARYVAEWHRQRADNFESKASVLLSFCGLLLTLAPLTAVPIGDVGGGWRGATGVLVALGAGLILAAAAAALLAVRPRRVFDANDEQLHQAWRAQFGDHDMWDERQVLGMLADQMLGPEGHESPVRSLIADADARGRQVAWAVVLLFAGIAAFAAAVWILLIEVTQR